MLHNHKTSFGVEEFDLKDYLLEYESVILAFYVTF
jgi:hypothetical protein